MLPAVWEAMRPFAIEQAGNPASRSEAKIAALGHPAVEAHAPVLSGRKLTIEKREQKHETSRHFDDDVYGVSFDFPKNYDLREGDLPDMDRGLGYLGKIPMEFSAPGGVRLAEGYGVMERHDVHW